MSTHYNIAKHSGVRTSSGGGGGGGGTVVSAVGKAVYYLGEHDVLWNEKQGELQPNDKVAYSFDSDESWLISVTSDGETPREDKTNVIFSSETKINNEFRVDFRAEINNNVYDSYIDVSSSAPQ